MLSEYPMAKRSKSLHESSNLLEAISSIHKTVRTLIEDLLLERKESWSLFFAVWQWLQFAKEKFIFVFCAVPDRLLWSSLNPAVMGEPHVPRITLCTLTDCNLANCKCIIGTGNNFRISTEKTWRPRMTTKVCRAKLPESCSSLSNIENASCLLFYDLQYLVFVTELEMWCLIGVEIEMEMEKRQQAAEFQHSVLCATRNTTAQIIWCSPRHHVATAFAANVGPSYRILNVSLVAKWWRHTSESGTDCRIVCYVDYRVWNYVWLRLRCKTSLEDVCFVIVISKINR